MSLPPAWTFTTTSRTSTPAICRWRTLSCCRIWAARRWKPATRWGGWCCPALPQFWPARRRQTRWHRTVTLRIAIGGFLHESHSFAPRPTTYADFLQPGGLPPFTAGDGLIAAMRPRPVPIAGAIGVAEEEGVALAPLAWCFANPAGPIEDAAFERIAARICACLSM